MIADAKKPENTVHLGLGWIGDRGGGLERYQHGICSAHARMGHQVTAWVQSDVAIGERDCSYDPVVFSSSNDSRTQRLKKLRKVAAARFSVPDFVMVSHHASVAANVVDLAREVPHTVHFHGPWAEEASLEGGSWWKTALQRRMERKTYQSADRIITLSRAFRDLVIEKYRVSPDIVRVVPGAIDCEAANPNMEQTEARERMRWPSDKKIVLSMRRLVRRVGVDVLVDAVSLLVKEDAEKYSDLLVLIGGSGPLKDELETRIEQLGLGEHVRLLGFVPEEFLNVAYRAADLSVVPTQALEGFGLVTLESLAAGTPVMVTPVGSLPEVVEPFESSLVLPGKSANDIADGLRRFMDGRLVLPDESQCREYVRENFDWSVIAPRVLDVYREAAAVKAQGAS